MTRTKEQLPRSESVLRAIAIASAPAAVIIGALITQHLVFGRQDRSVD